MHPCRWTPMPELHQDRCWQQVPGDGSVPSLSAVSGMPGDRSVRAHAHTHTHTHNPLGRVTVREASTVLLSLSHLQLLNDRGRGQAFSSDGAELSPPPPPSPEQAQLGTWHPEMMKRSWPTGTAGASVPATANSRFLMVLSSCLAQLFS